MPVTDDDDDDLRPLMSVGQADLAVCHATCKELRARLAQRDALVTRLLAERRHLAECLLAVLSSK
jgi:hypothetical protein